MAIYSVVDFADYSNGDLSAHADFTKGGGHTSANFTVTDGVLSHTSTNTSQRFNRLIWNPVSSDAERDDVEVVFKCIITATPVNSYGAGAQVRGTSGTVSYGVVINTERMHIYRQNGAGGSSGHNVQLEVQTLERDVDSVWWVRFRVEGTSIKAMAWLDGTFPPDPTIPENWNLSVTDSNITAVGEVGLGSLSRELSGNGLAGRYHQFQVATGGDSIVIDVEAQPGDIIHALSSTDTDDPLDGVTDLTVPAPKVGNLLVVGLFIRSDRKEGIFEEPVYQGWVEDQVESDWPTTPVLVFRMAYGIVDSNFATNFGTTISVSHAECSSALIYLEIEGPFTPGYLDETSFAFVDPAADNIVLPATDTTDAVPEIAVALVSAEGITDHLSTSGDFVFREQVMSDSDTSSNEAKLIVSTKLLGASETPTTTITMTSAERRLRGILATFAFGSTSGGSDPSGGSTTTVNVATVGAGSKPSAPTNLQVVPNGSGLLVTWSSNAAEHVVERERWVGIGEPI
jgi:hypothetical protein